MGNGDCRIPSDLARVSESFSVRFIPTRPYFRNVSLARIRSHRKLASNWLACALKESEKSLLSFFAFTSWNLTIDFTFVTI